MSETFLAALTIRNLDTEDNIVVYNSTSGFNLTLPSPVRENSFENVKDFNDTIIFPPPPSPCELFIINEDLNSKEDEIDNSRRCIIL